MDPKRDLSAGLVVFLVALPLCLGIAVASGAPPLAGLMAGIIGGIVVSLISGASLAVSGPAAGLTVIVLNGIDDLGGYEVFVSAVLAAGLIQILLGFLGAGLIGYFFPNAVIKGMLAGIGAILILKQLPHLFGHDKDPEGDVAFQQQDGKNTFTELWDAIQDPEPTAILIGLVGLAVLIFWPKIPGLGKQKILPAPLVVVGLGVVIHEIIKSVRPEWTLEASHMVQIPVASFTDSLANTLPHPQIEHFERYDVWKTGVVVAMIASIETLLCIEAIDRLDPEKRHTPLNRELKAQGIGNAIAGFLGALPLTAVIVRGSANVQAGGRTRWSAFAHGVMLLIAVGFLAAQMNLIPLAALAAVLLHVGYKLASVGLFKEMASRGTGQMLPFVVTVAAILLTDLLTGVGIGLLVGLGFLVKETTRQGIAIEDLSEDESHPSHMRINLGPQVTFLHKAAIRNALRSVPDGVRVDVVGGGANSVDPDVHELLEDAVEIQKSRGVEVVLMDVPKPRARLLEQPEQATVAE